MKKCLSCGAELPKKEKVCGACGATYVKKTSAKKLFIISLCSFAVALLLIILIGLLNETGDATSSLRSFLAVVGILSVYTGVISAIAGIIKGIISAVARKKGINTEERLLEFNSRANMIISAAALGIITVFSLITAFFSAFYAVKLSYDAPLTNINSIDDIMVVIYLYIISAVLFLLISVFTCIMCVKTVLDIKRGDVYQKSVNAVSLALGFTSVFSFASVYFLIFLMPMIASVIQWEKRNLFEKSIRLFMDIASFFSNSPGYVLFVAGIVTGISGIVKGIKSKKDGGKITGLFVSIIGLLLFAAVIIFSAVISSR